MRKLATAMFVVVISVAACGGDGDGGNGAIPPSGVSGSIQVPALTDADKMTLCDWFAGQMGGYGATDTCTDPEIDLVAAPANQAECLNDFFPTCDIAVGQLENCFKVIIGVERACTQQALAAAFTNADCQAALSAGCIAI